MKVSDMTVRACTTVTREMTAPAVKREMTALACTTINIREITMLDVRYDFPHNPFL